MNNREFVGARLELARTFHGITLKSLADTVAASHGLLGHYENGRRKQPSDDLVAALSAALAVRPGFFYEPLSDSWCEQECSFRRRALTPEGAKKRARAHGTFIGLVVRELSSFVKMPIYNVPAIKANTEDELERAAEQCRKHWALGMGPIEHIGRVAERGGIILIQNLQHAETIDAFSRRGETNVIVLNTVRTSASRWIFDVAHELGHFVLHSDVETGSKDTEQQANYFASALLLPRQVFTREFRARTFSWNHIFQLKRRWFASASSIIRRAFQLSLIDGLTYRRSYQQMSFRGWLKTEPYEPEFVGPEWLPSAFDVINHKMGRSIDELCTRLNLTPEIFSEITGVSADRKRVTLFKPRPA